MRDGGLRRFILDGSDFSAAVSLPPTAAAGADRARPSGIALENFPQFGNKPTGSTVLLLAGSFAGLKIRTNSASAQFQKYWNHNPAGVRRDGADFMNALTMIDARDPPSDCSERTLAGATLEIARLVKGWRARVSVAGVSARLRSAGAYAALMVLQARQHPAVAERALATRDTADARFQREIVCQLDAAYNFARFLSKDADAAQDIVQEAFLRGLPQLRRLSGRRRRAPGCSPSCATATMNWLGQSPTKGPPRSRLAWRGRHPSTARRRAVGGGRSRDRRCCAARRRGRPARAPSRIAAATARDPGAAREIEGCPTGRSRRSRRSRSAR